MHKEETSVNVDQEYLVPFTAVQILCVVGALFTFESPLTSVLLWCFVANSLIGLYFIAAGRKKQH